MSPEAIVYIVDDDEGSRYLLKCVLESVGLESRAFASAKEFLDAYIHPPGKGAVPFIPAFRQYYRT